jgi:MFS family permease
VAAVVTVHERDTIRLTWAWLFAALALLGLAAFLSLVVALLLRTYADISLPEDERGWAWIAIGWSGLLAAILFGSLAVIASRAGPRTGIVLGVLALLWALAAASIPSGPLAVVFLALSAFAALYLLWRWRKARSPHDR